jgi:hypothetical protein
LSIRNIWILKSLWTGFNWKERYLGEKGNRKIVGGEFFYWEMSLEWVRVFSGYFGGSFWKFESINSELVNEIRVKV